MLSVEIIPTFIHFILISTITDVAHAQYVYYPEIQRSMATYKVIATWDNAKRHCESEGAMLASPINKEILSHMKSTIGVNNHSTPYFIGMRARDDEKTQFVSEEGISLENIIDAAIDMIDQLDPLIGECLCMNQDSIRVVPCWTRLPYVCYRDLTPPETTDIPITTEPWFTVPTVPTEPTEAAEPTEPTETPYTWSSVDCGQGYERYATGHCYKFYNNMLTSWHEANRICTNEGGYLAVINNSAEARLIKQICFSGKSPFTFIWIGLHDVSGNKDWRSVHGDYLHVLYNIGELKSSRFDCGVIKYTGKLYDMHCGDSKSFICEKS